MDPTVGYQLSQDLLADLRHQTQGHVLACATSRARRVRPRLRAQTASGDPIEADRLPRVSGPESRSCRVPVRS
jgi:hypothetical protein